MELPQVPDQSPDSSPQREMRRGVRLGVDVGTVRIGVASCDRDGLLATPVETVKAEPRRASLDRLAALAAEYEAFEIVVGLPRSLSGGEGPAAAKIRGYARDLARRLGPELPVRLVDERLSTVTATQGLRASGVKAKKGRSVVDQAAAVVILQNALDAERMSGRPPGLMVQLEDGN
ncbi:putative Holliday junction resolvase [Catenulispora sp. GP43]|uniref:Holliday junction resolvase RuvX n=1 Tax=Catenulispora sp. GP43 TaxID=3156263 RepID=UPI003514F407